MTVEAEAKLGQPQILAPLGAGGRDEVWRARDTRLNREVAIKLLPPESVQGEARLRRFEQEARAVSALNQPTLPTSHEIGPQTRLPYLGSEFSAGLTLRPIPRRERLPWATTLDLAAQLAVAFAPAHKMGLRHRAEWAYAARSAGMALLKVESVFDNLRPAPRFKDWLKRLNRSE